VVFTPFFKGKTVERLRSAFELKENASLNVRDVNRKLIQPYIYAHPIGGGLATSGKPGEAYNPDHRLAGFPP
jgi:putative inorganic carbon (hco3(-)) transporter